MKPEYWEVTDEQVVEKTGKPLSHWERVLERFGASSRKSKEVVDHLQKEHGVPRYWARTLTTRCFKKV